MIIKNLPKEKILLLSDEISIQKGQIVSKTIIQNDKVSITLFSFDKGEEISTHKSKGDALVTILEGCADIKINDTAYSMKTGESIIMPADNPHSVYAKECFKMLLTVIF